MVLMAWAIAYKLRFYNPLPSLIMDGLSDWYKPVDQCAWIVYPFVHKRKEKIYSQYTCPWTHHAPSPWSRKPCCAVDIHLATMEWNRCTCGTCLQHHKDCSMHRTLQWLSGIQKLNHWIVDSRWVAQPLGPSWHPSSAGQRGIAISMQGAEADWYGMQARKDI